MPGESPGFFISIGGEVAKELSVIVDEDDDQADGIADEVSAYEAKLARADLPNIPFHSEPLKNGHKDYENLAIERRKALLAYFSAFVRRLPIAYVTFVYRRSEFEELEALSDRMSRDISDIMLAHLDFFQSFDDVKV